LPPAPFNADDNSSRLTEPSPFLSSLLKTSSACARLVPPAPSAFSNSDLLTCPSPLASSCENRSFSASARLVGAGDAVDAWLCAASSALHVAGDICEYPPDPHAGVEHPEAAAASVRLKGLVGAWLKPAVCDDDFDEVSACRASTADDTAPRAAGSMVELRQMPQPRGLYFHD
jgi:hypothetical protein